MARLFGAIGNRMDLLSSVLRAESAALAVPSSVPLGWGIGFYQGGEVLMRRRPSDEKPVLEPADFANDIRTETLVGHVRLATVGALRPENTHPFRYRSWLYAQTGTLPSFDKLREKVLGSTPDFLQANIRGESDAEAVFYLFLSFLHDGGAIDDTPVKRAKAALASTCSILDGFCSEAGEPPIRLNMLLSNGEYLVAVRRGAPMATRVYAGKADANQLIGDDAQLRRKVPEIDRMHFALVASDFGVVRSSGAPPASSPTGVAPDQAPGAPWVSIPDNGVTVVERGVNPVTESL